MPTDIPAEFSPSSSDFRRQVVRIPMRDGTELHTVLIIPLAVTRAPVILERTPYGATRYTSFSSSPSYRSQTRAWMRDLLDAGYVFALQDVRGKYDSGGGYLLTAPLGSPGGDHSTDAHDTIDWLVRELPECDGSVAITGTSYNGFAALMATLAPHPALKACVAVNPMVDGWKGDDFFRNGAFRQTTTAEYVYRQTTSTASAHGWPSSSYDAYEPWLRAGNATEMGREMGLAGLPAWERFLGHPDYDTWWREQAVDRLLAERPVTVPTLHVHSTWDSEDVHGSLQAWGATRDRGADVHLVIGPWSHTDPIFTDGERLGAFSWGARTARDFRRDVLLPFLDRHLREGDAEVPAVRAFETGSDTWRTWLTWPPAEIVETVVHLGPGGTLGWEPADPAGSDDFLSDPAHPVPYEPRPIRPQHAPGGGWDDWQLRDQRFASDRPDVLTWTSVLLVEPLRLAGAPVAHLVASTTGTDADWVVKLIDVFPDEVPEQEELGGHQLPLAMEIIRARHRNDPGAPEPLVPGEAVTYCLELPHVSHVLAPGHRLMVQVQSSWFPLYDRNPQTFVPSIMDATPESYVRAWHTVHHASTLSLPVVP